MGLNKWWFFLLGGSGLRGEKSISLLCVFVVFFSLQRGPVLCTVVLGLGSDGVPVSNQGGSSVGHGTTDPLDKNTGAGAA